MTVQVASIDVVSPGLAPTLTGTVTVGGQPVTGVKGGQLVTLTVVPSGTFSAVAFAVRSDAAPGVVLSGTGNTRTFVAPYLMDGADAMVTVVASGANGDSDPLTLGVTVYPHSEWYVNAAGTAWLPVKSTLIL